MSTQFSPANMHFLNNLRFGPSNLNITELSSN